MKRVKLIWAIFVVPGLVGFARVVSLSAAAPASSATKPMDPDRAAAVQIISQLDDADPDVRKLAALRLNSMGGSALEVVEAALKADDVSPEARVRLEGALKYVLPRAKLQNARAAQATWRSELFHNAYRDGGHTDPKFDADAHAAIDLYLALGLDPLHPPAESRAKVLAAFAKATRAGCVDPMVLALARVADGTPETRIARPDRGTGAEGRAYACYRGNYPPVVKFHVWAILCSWMYAEDNAVILGELLEQALATPNVPFGEIDEPLRLFSANIGKPAAQPKWTELLDRYEQLAPRSPGPMMLKANLSISSAMWYRSEMVKANTFEGGNMVKFARMLQDTVDLADKAYQRDPLAPEPPRFALRTLLLLSDYGDPRQATDLWFERAIAADVDDREAFELKINNYLSQGDDAVNAVLEFGRTSMCSQNWRGGVALSIVVAHEKVANLSGDRQKYFADPRVWEDISTTYQGSLANFPDDLEVRCEFAKYATICGHWDVADELFKTIGDMPVMSVFGSESSYKYLRNKAKRLAAELSPAGTEK